MIQGTVDGATKQVTFAPLTGSLAMMSGASPAVYGNQGSTVTVDGVVDSVITVAGVRRTWYVRIKLRNLESFPIGSNYPGAVAADSSGVFLFFITPPIVGSPSPCACTVTVSNPSGTTNFTAPSQKYFWYDSRPLAMQGSPGTDTTTNNPEWQFTTAPFSGADTASSFSFVLKVSAAWPPPNEATWTVAYDATADTLPDVYAKPRWKLITSTPDPIVGTRTWTAGTELVMVASTSTTSIYESRHDSLGTQSAYMDVYVKANVSGGSTFQGVFGFVEPQGSGRKQVFAGVYGDGASFVTFSEASGAWTQAGTDCQVLCQPTTTYHRYRLRKIGITSVELCRDGISVATRTYASLQTIPIINSWGGSSVIFGVAGAAASVTSKWQSVTYVIGSDGGSC